MSDSNTKYAMPAQMLEKTQNMVMLLAFFVACGLLFWLTGILCSHYHPATTVDQVNQLFVAAYAAAVTPNPKERFVYLVLVCCIPFVSFLAVRLAILFTPRRKILYYTLYLLSMIAAGFIAVFTIYVFKSSLYMSYLDLNTTANWRLLLLAIVAATYFWVSLQKQSANQSTFLQSRTLFLMVSVVVLIPPLAYRIITLYTENRGYLYGLPHFGAVFYSVTQVVAGKTLLVNLPAQYGLYGEFLNPIFEIIGLSVFKFVTVMTSLTVIGMLCLFGTMRKALQSPLLAIFCIISLSCYISYAFYGYGLTFKGYHLLEPISVDPYYQYFPIRFIFPAISVYLFAAIFQKREFSVKSIVLLAVISTCAVLWNIDSGIPVLGAFLAYLSSYLLFPSLRISRLQAIKLLSIAVSTILLFTAMFMLYLTWKADGRALHFSWLYKYQYLFSKVGLNKVSLPVSLDPWQLIFSLYVLGITNAIYRWSTYCRSFTSDLVFYLSILGIGLFTYYEYRALAICLIPSSWPAVMIAFIFSDSIYKSIREKTLPRFFSIICYPVILFSMITLITLMHFLPVLYRYEIRNIATVKLRQENFVIGNLKFIEAHLDNEKEVVILSGEQAIYFGQLGLASAIDGPGTYEILLKSDVDSINKQLQKSEAKLVFAQAGEENYETNYQPPLDMTFLQNYRLAATSPYGLQMFVKK